MGGFQNFAISFTIISILAGCLTSYYIAFNQGGPIAITWGWLLVGVFCIIVAIALGEIASVYPTAGGPLLLGLEAREPGLGLVHRLVQPRRPDRGDGGDRLRLRGLHDLAPEPAVGTTPTTMRWVFFTYALILLGAGLVNMFRVPITAMLNTFSAWWHMVGRALVIVGILIVVPDNHKSVGYVFGETLNNTGFSGNSLEQLHVRLRLHHRPGDGAVHDHGLSTPPRT